MIEFDFNEDDTIYLPPEDEVRPFWTRGRIIYAIIALVVIIAFLTMTLWPTLQTLFPPVPKPAPLPYHAI